VSAELDELEELERKAHALALMDELGIYGRMRDEMRTDVDRAIAVLTHARDARGARNRAALAIANWRRGADPRPGSSSRAMEAEPDPPEQPPSLSALEYAWSLPASPIATAVLAMAGYSIERNGGASAMLAAGWWTREHFPDLDA